ncbi:MAG TPA: hypothetical protein VD993_12600 [Chitinophagaceae bacterium]|nr:hypothetical protein [Chitinophagaceae bacterium]
MSASLLRNLCFVILFAACASASRNARQPVEYDPIIDNNYDQPSIAAGLKPLSLMDLPQTQDGGFVLAPGLYEAEFKTYCLQPGTPDPRPGDAYLQGPVTGYRKDIVESVLLNSRHHSQIPQKHVQLLLWSVVSGADFNKLSSSVQSDAMKLLTPRQVFELKGGVAGVIKTVASSGIFKGNSGMQRLFEMGTTSYESFERIAVLREPSQIKKHGVKYDRWYKQSENYYIRYFPASYQKVKIQVYVPDSLLDAEHKLNGDYLVFDPTGQQASPAFTNAQRLGIGAPVLEVIRVIIQVNKQKKANTPPAKTPDQKRKSRPGQKQF